MKKNLLLLFVISFVSSVYSQSGTFGFESGVTGDATYLSQTVSSVTFTMYSDHSASSITAEDWSSYPGVFTQDVATMNGIAKPSLTITFSQAVNIASLVVAEFNSVNQHLKFTPNTGTAYDMTIDGAHGSVVNVHFIHITSMVITDYNGGANTVNLGIDNVIMDATLPVEITLLNASVNNNSITLKWSTATEVNNYGFNVERKSEITDWTKIGFVKGNGNSNSSKDYTFADNSNLSSGNYSYRLKQIDNDGQYKYSKVVEVAFNSPDKISLNQNYPNPFNPSTTITYSLPEKAQVSLAVFDVLGREVADLVDKEQESGNYSVKFEASNLNSGIYFYKLKAGSFIATKKFVLVK